MDPEAGGFVDENGIPLQEGIFERRASVYNQHTNALLSDDESEMLIRIPTEKILSIASLPIIELEQSVNNPDSFAFSAYGYKSSTMFLETEYQSDYVSFVKDQIVGQEITLSYRENPLGSL